MWCRHCQQDVAGVPRSPHGVLGCTRCGEPFSIRTPMEASVPASSTATASASMGGTSPISAATGSAAESRLLPPRATSSGFTLPVRTPEDLGRKTDEAIQSLRRTLDVLDVAMDRMFQELPVPSGDRLSESNSPSLGSNSAAPSKSQDQLRSISPDNRETQTAPSPYELLAGTPWAGLADAIRGLEGATAFSIPNDFRRAELSPETVRSPASAVPTKPSSDRPTTIPTEPVFTPAAPSNSAKTIAALDREIRTIEEVLKSWQPRPASRKDAATRSLVRHFGDDAIQGRLSRRREGFRSQIVQSVQRLRLTERQVSLVLLANIAFFIAAAIAGVWTLIDSGAWFLGHLIGVGITGQICTMFCLAWLLTHTRSVADSLEGADQEFAKAWRQGSSELRDEELRELETHQTELQRAEAAVADRAATAERFERSDPAESAEAFAHRAPRRASSMTE